jgi:TRAP-type C4-dicarboxylate transport system permease small subunit
LQKLLQKIRKVCDKFIKLERIICCLLLVAILAVCFWSVVMRYCFNSPLSWSEEVIIVLLVWFGYLCMSVETYNDTNIAITGFYAILPKGVQKACNVMRHVILAVFFYLMTSNSYKIFVLNSRKRLPASQWNQGLQYFPIVLGGALMLVFSVLNLVGELINEKREFNNDVMLIEEEKK